MKTTKILVAFNDCYGEFPRGLKREFDSIEDFQETCMDNPLYIFINQNIHNYEEKNNYFLQRR